MHTRIYVFENLCIKMYEKSGDKIPFNFYKKLREKSNCLIAKVSSVYLCKIRYIRKELKSK